MKLIINGESTEITEGTSVQAMLADRGVDSRKVAVERSGVIVSKSAFAQTLLTEGDHIEIIGFIGGG